MKSFSNKGERILHSHVATVRKTKLFNTNLALFLQAVKTSNHSKTLIPRLGNEPVWK